MAKKEQEQKNDSGKKLIMAPAIMVGSLGLCLLCLTYLNIFRTGTSLDRTRVLGTTNATVLPNNAGTEDKINYWEKIVADSPTYRDGWIRLSVEYYNRGEIDKATEALEKAKEIDPNNETVNSLRMIIRQ